ncbi:MAG TPA: hypothetical protein VGO93_00275 [Candidatus Xenobia bacterium]|jgi:predicted regulator of Ras-like GTPase activity (Roadblock/LC7/MglB family)
MQLTRARLYHRVPPRAEEGLWEDLRGEYRGLLSSVKEQFWKALHFDFHSLGEARPGDVFWVGDGLMYYYVPPARDYVEAGFTGHEPQGRFHAFCTRLAEAVGAEGGWRTFHEANPTFEILREEAGPLPATHEDISAAALLTDDLHRNVLRQACQGGPSSMEALAGGADLLSAGTAVANLEQGRLLQREYTVFCKKTGLQISRLKMLEEIAAVSRSGFKCPHCGLSYQEERVDQVVTCTPAGVAMSRPNHWLALATLQVFNRLDMAPADVLHVVEHGGHSVDLFVQRQGRLLLVEPHDGALGLGEAFLFAARAEFYHPDAAVLLTTAPLGAEVERYLASRSRVRVARGLAAFESMVQGIFAGWDMAALLTTLEQFDRGTEVDVGDLVVRYFFGPESQQREAPIDSETRPTSHETYLDKPLEEEQSPLEGAPEPIPMLAAAEEEHVPAEAGFDTELVTAEKPLEDSFEYEPPYQADFVTVGVEPLAHQQEQHANEELRELAVKRLVDEIHYHGVIERLGAVERLREAGVAAAVVGEDGLLLASNLDASIDAELSGALAIEVAETMQRSLAEADFPAASLVTARAAHVTWSLHTLPSAVLAVHERRPTETVEEEPFHMQSEMDLRGAILKRVLDDLSRQDGIQANIVVNREGLVIEHQSVPHLEEMVHMWAAVLSQALIDVERGLQRMGAVPLRQLLVWTPKALISIVPLDREGILVSMLDNTAPRETYSNRLLKAATMLTSVFL